MEMPMSHEIQKIVSDDADLSELYALLGRARPYGNAAEDDEVKKRVLSLHKRLNH